MKLRGFGESRGHLLAEAQSSKESEGAAGGELAASAEKRKNVKQGNLAGQA